MKKIALISPGILPVPAVRGGAVEVLIQHLVDCNERNQRCEFTLYTVADPDICSQRYKHTKVVQVQQSRFGSFLYKCLNFLFRKIRLPFQLNYYNRTVRKHLKKESFELAVVQNSPGVFDAVYRTIGEIVPIWFHMHNNIDKNRTLEKCKFVVDHSERIIVVSNYLKRHLNENVPTDHTDVVYNCVDSNLFSPDKSDGSELRNELRISDDEVVFLFSGRVNEDKGVRELVKAFTACAKAYPKARLLIVGSSWFDFVAEDAYLAEVKQLAKQLGDRIIFTGYKKPDEMPKAYAAADVVVIPSMWDEPFGVVGLEAMAMGKAIITTDSGGLVEFLNDENAIIVHRKNFDSEMTKAMMRLIQDPAYRHYLGSTARQNLLARPEFDSKNYLDYFLEINR